MAHRRPPRSLACLNLELGEHAEHQHSPTAKKTSQQQCLSTTPQLKRRKRSLEAGDLSFKFTTARPPKRPRPRATSEPTATSPAVQKTSSGSIDPIDYWRREHTWPKEYFEPDGTMEPPLAKAKSTPPYSGERSMSGGSASSATPSDQKPRDQKSAPYRDARYKILLETKGSYMRRSELDITRASKDYCRNLLETEQSTPSDSLFQDETFDRACEKLQDRNEARVVRDIAQLIVPSAETLATFGAKSLEVLIESVNEGWNNSMPLTGTRPQPDYSVGFNRTAFTKGQFDKLSPYIGDFLLGGKSSFMATYYMYFPFLTCEVKCGAAGLDIADRQNAHSMTLAVRAVVELFRLVKREDEINQEILSFSVSHDDRSVRIYGHYAVIDGPTTTFYRHPIHTFDFQALEGREKWTAHKFTKNVYNAWMPAHFKRLCSAIDDIPSGLDFGVPPLGQDSGFTRGL